MLEDDLVFTNGQLTVCDINTACAQKLRARLQFFLGEWFLDTNQGFPYLQYVFGVKNVNLGIAKQLFQNVLLSTSPIIGINSISLSLNNLTRALDFEFNVQLQSGATISGSSDGPFIVSAT